MKILGKNVQNFQYILALIKEIIYTIENSGHNCPEFSIGARLKIIIVKDIIKPAFDDDGILTINLFDFLLNEDSLDF